MSRIRRLPSRARRRGFTIAEVLVYTFVFSLLMSAVYGVFSMTLEYFRGAEVVSDLQLNAQAAVSNMVRDVADSRASTVKISSSPTAIIFLSPRNSLGRFAYDASGQLLWQRWICYQVAPAGGVSCLLRSELPITPTATPPVNDKTVADFSPGTVVARNVSSLTVSGASTITISLQLSRQVRTEGDNECRVQSQVRLRN